MFNSSKPVSAKNLKEYFKDDFKKQSQKQKDNSDRLSANTAEADCDTSQLTAVHDPGASLNANFKIFWHGRLAKKLGLPEEVSPKHFKLICEGKHPLTGKELIKSVKSRIRKDYKGKEYETLTHRAGMPQTVSAPKSVSLLLPHDRRIIEAHQKAVVKALDTVEKFSRVKMGNSKPSEQTGESLRALFVHIEARPDAKTGFASLDLHTHCPPLNLSFDSMGKPRALEFREILRSQKLGTSVYRAELVKEMRGLGYEMQINDKTGAPEVVGISREYIEATSTRHREIVERAAVLGIKSTKEIAVSYRQSKKFDRDEMNRRREELEEKFGFEAKCTAESAIEKTKKSAIGNQGIFNTKTTEQSEIDVYKAEKVREAVDLIIAQNKERKINEPDKTWVSRQNLLTETLEYARFELTIDDIMLEFEKRAEQGELALFELDRRGRVHGNLSPKEKPNFIENNSISTENYVESINTTIADSTNSTTSIDAKPDERNSKSIVSGIAGNRTTDADDADYFSAESGSREQHNNGSRFVESKFAESEFNKSENRFETNSIERGHKQSSGIADLGSGNQFPIRSSFGGESSIDNESNLSINGGTNSAAKIPTERRAVIYVGDGNSDVERSITRQSDRPVQNIESSKRDSSISLESHASESAVEPKSTVAHEQNRRGSFDISGIQGEISDTENSEKCEPELLANKNGFKKSIQHTGNTKTAALDANRFEHDSAVNDEVGKTSFEVINDAPRQHDSKQHSTEKSELSGSEFGNYSFEKKTLSRTGDSEASKKSIDQQFTEQSLTIAAKNLLDSRGGNLSEKLSQGNDERKTSDDQRSESENLFLQERINSSRIDSGDSGSNAGSILLRDGGYKNSGAESFLYSSKNEVSEQHSQKINLNENSLGNNRPDLHLLGESDDLLDLDAQHRTNGFLFEHTNLDNLVSRHSYDDDEDLQDISHREVEIDGRGGMVEVKDLQQSFANDHAALDSDSVLIGHHEQLVSINDGLVFDHSHSLDTDNIDNQNNDENTLGIKPLSDQDRLQILDFYRQEFQECFEEIDRNNNDRFNAENVIELQKSSSGLYQSNIDSLNSAVQNETAPPFSQQPLDSDIYAQTEKINEVNRSIAEELTRDQIQIQTQTTFETDIDHHDSTLQFDEVRRNFVTYSSSSNTSDDDFWKNDRMQREAEIAREKAQMKSAMSEEERIAYEAAELEEIREYDMKESAERILSIFSI